MKIKLELLSNRIFENKLTISQLNKINGGRGTATLSQCKSSGETAAGVKIDDCGDTDTDCPPPTSFY